VEALDLAAGLGVVGSGVLALDAWGAQALPFHMAGRQSDAEAALHPGAASVLLPRREERGDRSPAQRPADRILDGSAQIARGGGAQRPRVTGRDRARKRHRMGAGRRRDSSLLDTPSSQRVSVRAAAPAPGPSTSTALR
jgi:hypothetical protein